MAINLIPPQIKKKRKLDKTIIQVLSGLWVVFTMVIIFAGSLYFYNSSLITAENNWQEKIDEQKTRNKSLSNTESEIKKVNDKISRINNIIISRINWSTILESIGNSTPKNIQITTLNLDKNSKLISLQGLASSRKDIAFMKEKLEESDRFKNVTFSTSSFNEQTNDYNFTLTMGLN